MNLIGDNYILFLKIILTLNFVIISVFPAALEQKCRQNRARIVLLTTKWSPLLGFNLISTEIAKNILCKNFTSSRDFISVKDARGRFVMLSEQSIAIPARTNDKKYKNYVAKMR